MAKLPIALVVEHLAPRTEALEYPWIYGNKSAWGNEYFKCDGRDGKLKRDSNDVSMWLNRERSACSLLSGGRGS